MVLLCTALYIDFNRFTTITSPKRVGEEFLDLLCEFLELKLRFTAGRCPGDTVRRSLRGDSLGWMLAVRNRFTGRIECTPDTTLDLACDGPEIFDNMLFSPSWTGRVFAFMLLLGCTSNSSFSLLPDWKGQGVAILVLDGRLASLEFLIDSVPLAFH